MDGAIDSIAFGTPLVLRHLRSPRGASMFDLRVQDGRVVEMAPSLTPPRDVEIVECDGRVLLPGLWDMHVHVGQWALHRGRIDLSSATSASEVAAVLGAASAGRGRDDLVIGAGMRMALWEVAPHKDVLDAATGDVPVVAANVDLHTAWCNSAALAHFDVPDHEGGDNGLVREASGYRVLEELANLPTTVQDREVAAAMAAAAAMGITGVKDFEFVDSTLDWQRRIAASMPSVRIETTVYLAALDAAIGRGLATGEVVPDTYGLVRAPHLKLFTDGALNSGTALCHEVRGDGTATSSGHRAMTTDDMLAAVRRGWASGIQPDIHAIGDLAVTVALDVIEEVGCPARMEHVQLVASDDIARFARPDLVASVQPAHCTDDRDVLDQDWADRADRAYPFASLLAAGARLEFGTDAPVSPLDPWAAISAAVTRTDDDRPPWQPQECIDRRAALAASTRGRTGIVVGDVADLVVVDDDPLTCPVEALRDPGVALTLLQGRPTHRTI